MLSDPYNFGTSEPLVSISTMEGRWNLISFIKLPKCSIAPWKGDGILQVSSNFLVFNSTMEGRLIHLFYIGEKP